MGFPLKDWIDAHDDAPHNLARSGMRGTLATVRAALSRHHPPPDPERLHGELAAHLGIPRRRVFLTHGATEANALALVYLGRHHTAGRRPTVRWTSPEYPPLGEAARWAGYQRTRGGAHVVVLSSPNNPTGRGVGSDGVRQALDHARWAVVDETFREFTERAPVSQRWGARVFSTGTFTKAWAGDAIRVGFVIVPPAEVEAFTDFHGIVTDELPLASVSAARALLSARKAILSETRARFRRNADALAAALPESAGIEAPVWFDGLGGKLDGQRFASALLRRGVLVCPGSYFGKARGVRLCLTQPSFPEDLAVYLSERARWT